MQKRILFNKTYFFFTVLLFVIEILIAKYIHDDFIRPYIGDLLVVILIYCFVKSFFNINAIQASIAVLLFAYFIEMLQYFKLVNLLGLQQNKIACIIIGTSFSWIDMLMYTIGILIIILIEKKFH